VSSGRECRNELLRFIIDAEATADTDAFFWGLKERLKERFRQIESGAACCGGRQTPLDRFRRTAV
jgi:hypothetical protein